MNITTMAESEVTKRHKSTRCSNAKGTLNGWLGARLRMGFEEGDEQSTYFRDHRRSSEETQRTLFSRPSNTMQ